VSDAPEDDAVELEATEELDLHSFAPRDVPSLVEEYLRACRDKGILEVRIVHGRGKGVQRAVVARLLSQLECVAGFREAPPQSGGWGATFVKLKSSEKS